MRIPVIPLLLFASGCSDVGSSDVLTSGMYANLSVVASGDGTSTAAAVLRVGGANSLTFVELDGDDRLSATLGDETREMKGQELLDYHRYVTTFDDDTPDVTYTIAFERSIDDGAPESTMTLPDPFNLDPLEPPASMAQDLTLTWAPSGSDETMAVTVSGECVEPWSSDISGDPGTFTIEAGTLQPVDAEQPTSCTVDVQVTRSRLGSADPGYGEGGRAVGMQSRTVSVQMDPS